MGLLVRQGHPDTNHKYPNYKCLSLYWSYPATVRGQGNSAAQHSKLLQEVEFSLEENIVGDRTEVEAGREGVRAAGILQ